MSGVIPDAAIDVPPSDTGAPSSEDAVANALRRIGADSVYMLLHHGWSREPRANRWHFASRWTRHLPVTLVVPERPFLGRAVYPEHRLPNCRILKVLPNRGPIWGTRAQLQTGQILSDMQRSGARAPLLWIYNAEYAEAFATLPASARIHHVTENYFHYDELQPLYLDRLKFVASVADLNVAVSDGCAEPLRPLCDGARVMVATNGCDYRSYGGEQRPDAQVAAFRTDFHRVGVFGGQINDRLDLALIEEATRVYRDDLFLFVGSTRLSRDGQARWSELLRRANVRSLGEVDPDRLPAIYHAADFGFIPYVTAPLIAENGFPLKALEMAATGLPVVSTFMRPLQRHSPPLTVATNSAEFLRAINGARRQPELDARLRELAAANDYDARFASIVSRAASLDLRRGTRLDMLEQHFPEATARTLQLLLQRRWGRRLFFWHSRQVVVARIGWLVDMLPRLLRERVVNAKRSLLGGPTVKE